MFRDFKINYRGLRNLLSCSSRGGTSPTLVVEGKGDARAPSQKQRRQLDVRPSVLSAASMAATHSGALFRRHHLSRRQCCDPPDMAASEGETGLNPREPGRASPTHIQSNDVTAGLPVSQSWGALHKKGRGRGRRMAATLKRECAPDTW